MTGDYTGVPLRARDRWTGARMQQGRVLLDTDWNLNLDAAARQAQALAADTVGPAGVVAGTPDFSVQLSAGELLVQPGRMWVGGLLAVAPSPLRYGDQPGIAPLPASGRVLVYLDVYPEHVTAAEDPSLLDPALDGVDTTTRTRVGYRVRVAPTAASACTAALADLPAVEPTSGTLTVQPVAAPPADPCAPPAAPATLHPAGLLRVEVLARGTRSTARLAWSFTGGAQAVPCETAGAAVTVQPVPGFEPAVDDLLEVSWRDRRADRVDHGSLYRVTSVAEIGGGRRRLTLDRAVVVPTEPAALTALPAGDARRRAWRAGLGLVARRWDGQTVGLSTPLELTRGTGTDGTSSKTGVRVSATSGTYEVGSWWGARLRSASGATVEPLAAAPPDGTPHVLAPLAVVDLGTGAVLGDCRPSFRPLREQGGTCTVAVRPGDDLQAAVDRLPASGGQLCLAAGHYSLPTPLLLAARSRVVLRGAGPATVLSGGSEAVLVLRDCADVTVRDLRVQGGTASLGTAALDGAVTIEGSRRVTLVDCELSCRSGWGRARTCLTARAGTGQASDDVRVLGNRFEVGTWQTGVLVTDTARARVERNVLEARRDDVLVGGTGSFLPRELSRLVRAAARPATGGGQAVTVSKDHGVHRLATDLVDAGALVSGSGPLEDRLPRAVRAFGHGRRWESVSEAARGELRAVVDAHRCAGQGIVVGGGSRTDVVIAGNEVVGAVQGIHVGISDDRRPGVERAGDVRVTGNVARCAVPASYDLDRHGVYVSNALSVRIADTLASCQRTRSSEKPSTTATPVDGIKVTGRLGGHVSISGSTLEGFTTGVRIDPFGPTPARVLWRVVDTYAAGAGMAVRAPARAVTAHNERSG
jgi:hypothetical protein